MPATAQQSIKQLVQGEAVDTFEIGGTTHRLLKVSGDVFKKVFIENRMYLYKGDYTAPPDENDYLHSSNYLSDDGLAGFSITKNGWLVSLFSNYRYSGFAKAIKPYVVNNAYKLVCIVANTEEGNRLVELYRHLYGFKIYAITINDIDIMREYYGDEFIDNFISKSGTPFHVFMVGENVDVEGTEIKRFTDYFAAEAYVDNTVSPVKNSQRST